MLLLTVALLPGCSSTGSSPATRFPAAPGDAGAGSGELPPPGESFPYVVQNENCRCERYAVSDRFHPVRYLFEASYSMGTGFITSIDVEIDNRGPDTLFLDPGSVMVSSRNINYQYNNRFIPLPALVIGPGDSDELHLEGTEVTASPDWRKIAGEHLTLTIKGMRIGGEELAQQVIEFVPVNPLLRDPD